MQSRVDALRERLTSESLDAIVITHPSNRFYLSGYTAQDHPPNESAGHLLVGRERAVLVTSHLEAERAHQQATGFEIAASAGSFAQTDATVLLEMAARRVGFEDEAILHKDYVALQDGLGDGVELVPVGGLVDDLRHVKSEDEIAIIARAIDITDRAFESVAAGIQVDDTELQIAARLDHAMREFGAEGVAFPTIVASGPNAALPHHDPSTRAIQPGEPIIIDMGALLEGYNADLTRTVWVGEPNETLRAIYPVVRQALEAAEAGLRAGLTGREGDAIARDVITEAGFGEYFVHSLGHGLGVRVHEGPNLSPRYERRLPVGSVVTIEPGIYLPGKGGVRIEDVAVIREEGVQILTRASKQTID